MPTDLKDMQYSVSERQERLKPLTDGPMPESVPDYPYGLCLYLDHESLQKLGLASADLKGGQQVTGQFIGMITSSGGQLANGQLRKKMDIQIQKLALAPSQERDRAEQVYGSQQT